MLQGWPKLKRSRGNLDGYPVRQNSNGNLSGWPDIAKRLDPTHPLAQGLVGWWPLDEGQGIVARDLSICRNKGTLTGMADPATATSGWGAGSSQRELAFDGSNDYVSVPHDTRHQFSTKLTFCAWVRPTSGTAYPPLLTKTNGATDGYSWEFNNGGVESSLALWRYAGGWGSNGYTSITNAVWSFVAVTLDATNEKRYVNGALIATYASAITISASTVALQIGGNTSLGRYGGGSFAHLRLYNRGLAAAEIAQICADKWIGTA